jgi:hypothetical protein
MIWFLSKLQIICESLLRGRRKRQFSFLEAFRTLLILNNCARLPLLILLLDIFYYSESQNI